MAHRLVPRRLLRSLPRLPEVAPLGKDVTVWVCLTAPWNNWRWLIIASDGEDMLYGMMVPLGREIDAFSLRALSQLRGPQGQRLQRDRRFRPAPLRSLLGQRPQDTTG